MNHQAPSNIRLILSYDGTVYYGWQETAEGPSIEGMLRAALEKVLQQKVKLQAASRTDAGVHAAGQVINFFLEKPRPFDQLQKSLNQLLPKDIRVEKIEEATPDFHPTIDSQGKEYHYHLSTTPIQLPFERHYAWHIPMPLDLKKMETTASFFLGKHDFKAFCNESYQKPKDTIRTLHRCAFVQDNDSLRIEIKGDHFLYKMVRNLVGTIVYVGLGKLSLEQASKLIKNKDRTLAGITAPAHGLLLKKVFYHDLT